MDSASGAQKGIDSGHERSSSTFERLVSIRSRLTEDLVTFLSTAQAALDATPWTHPHNQRPILASQVFVDLDVLLSVGDREVTRSQPDAAPKTEADAARYELPSTSEGRGRVRWSHLLRKTGHFVLTGAPGSGKSFLTRHAAASRLRSAYDDLRARRVSVVDLPATVWVSATALASVNHVPSAGEALVDAVISSLELSSTDSAARVWLEHAVQAASALIIVDAVDEVGVEHYAMCRRRLRETIALPGRVIITCRTLQWELLKHELLPSSPREEVELAPLTSVQVRSMIDRLSGNDASRRMQVTALLNRNTALQRASTGPLRLMFIHLLVGDGRLSASTNYAGLYMHLVRALLEGRWRARQPRWASRPARVERVIAFLTTIAWSLFSSTPAGNRFTLAAWIDAAGWARRTWVSEEQLLEDLVELGIVAPAGFDDLGSRCWSFAHRTLLEYLAARQLASRPTDEWLTEARSHFWYQPEWTEVLIFLASAVPDATPLIVAVDCERDDVFGSMLELQSRLIGVSRHVAPRTRRIALRVWGLMLSDPLRGADRSRFEESVRALGWDHLGPLFTTAVRFGSSQSRQVAVNNLDLVRSEDAIGVLVHVLRHDSSHWCRVVAIWGLERTTPPEATEALVEALTTAETTAVRREAARALGSLADPRSIEALVRAMRDPDASVRESAAGSLGDFSERDLVQPLIDLLRREPESTVRVNACIALSRVGGRDAVDPLLHSLGQDRDPRVRRAAARALVGTGAPEVIRLLVELCAGDQDPTVQLIAGRGLREMGALPMLEPRRHALIHSLQHDEDPQKRRQAAAALCYLPSAFGDLCSAYIDDLDASVRMEVLHAFPDGLSDQADRAVRERQVSLMLRLTEGALDVASVVDVLHYFNSVPRRLVMPARDSDALHAVTDLLHTDQDPKVRKRAADLLALWVESHAVDTLVTALNGDPDRNVRHAAAGALGKLAIPVAVEALAQVASQTRIAGENPLARESRMAAFLSLKECRGRYRGKPLRGRPAAMWQPAAAIALNRFGLELRDRRRLREARVMLHASLSLDRGALGWQHPKIPHRLMNLASVELMLGRIDRARRLLHRAWRWQAGRADLTAARILVLRMLIACLQDQPREPYLGQLKSILGVAPLPNMADVDDYWSIRSLTRSVQARLTPPDAALVRALVNVLNGTQGTSVLDECEVYRAQLPVSLNDPWTLVHATS